MGIELPQPPKFDMSKAVAFTQSVVKRMTSGIGTLMKGNHIDVFEGLGSGDASRTVTVTKGERASSDGSTQKLSASKIILASGAVPCISPFPGVDRRNVISSDTCCDL